MSLTLLSRPIGHKLNSTDIAAVIIDDGTSDALVYTETAHGLSDGDYIFMESNLDSYNGFFYVDSIAYDSFKIRTSEQGDFVEYVQGADISYRTSVLNHGWQSVHLPIVYELESDIWPNNVAEEAYTPIVIDSFEDVNGNTQLNLSAALADPTALNFIELLAPDPTFSIKGPYQILSVTQPWSIVINLAYDSTFDFTGYQVVNYYNNYAINVEVYAGLSSDHRWVSKKPYELAATLKFIPDSDGKIKFSIADILKGYITTRNNLTLDTLPNNLDFHVSFYIKYYESYDQSDGETIATFDGDTTEDTFEGHAVNSMMPFKSLNSGHMSDYVNEGSFLARWLTLMDRPLIFVGRFFDISFINQFNALDVTVTKNGALYLTITNPGQGVIRVPVEALTGETEICLQASASGSGGATLNLESFQNNPEGGTDWSTGATPSVILPSGTSDWLFIDFDFIEGATYTITTDIYNWVATPAGGFLSAILDNSFNILESESTNIAGGGTDTNVLIFTAGSGYTKLAFRTSGLSSNVDVNSSAFVYEITDMPITESICCDVVDECSPTFVNDMLRITEASQLREIE